jgi:hypothetical protein
MKTVFQCDGCHHVHSSKVWIFHCVDCGREICDDCMYGWGTCKGCAMGKTDTFLRERFDKEHEIVAP